MWLNDYLAGLTGLVDDDRLHSALLRIAALFDFVPGFVLEMLLSWCRFEEKDTSEFPRIENSAVPMPRHREGAGKISG